MSTYLEICQSVLEEVDGNPSDLDSTNLGKDSNGNYYITNPTERNVVRWVDDLYLILQQKHVQADFMHSRGVFIQALDGVREYSKRFVREIDFDSFYLVPDGSSGRVPVCVMDWDSWQEDERSGDSSEGYPQFLVRMPSEKWLLDPVPSVDCDIYGSWWCMPSRFLNQSSEPIWDAQFHDILKWQAVQMFAAEFAQEAQYEVLMLRVRQMLPTLEREFGRRYLPSYVGAAPLC